MTGNHSTMLTLFGLAETGTMFPTLAQITQKTPYVICIIVELMLELESLAVCGLVGKEHLFNGYNELR